LERDRPALMSRRRKGKRDERMLLFTILSGTRRMRYAFLPFKGTPDSVLGWQGSGPLRNLRDENFSVISPIDGIFN
jgi:hypothetical protein